MGRKSMTDRRITPFLPEKMKSKAVHNEKTGENNLSRVSDRKALLEKLLDDMAAVRKRINPEILDQVQNMIAIDQEPSVATSGMVAVDRDQNVKAVMKFLEMPEGQHLREKLFPAK